MISRCELEVEAGEIVSVRRGDRARLKLDGVDFPISSGSYVVPGFVDTHCHLIGLGMMAARVSLRGLHSARECARRIHERALAQEKGTWIVGYGWNQEEWDDCQWPHRSVLDELIPDHPVVLQRVDTHASWVNTRAIEEAGLEVRDVDGGRIVLDDEGLPSGVLIDAAMQIIERALPEPTDDEKMSWISWSARECARLGITEVHDMNVEPERLEAMMRVADGGEMLVRCRVFLSAMKGEWRALPEPTPLARNLDTVGVKFFADGALGSRGAYLLEPYADADTRGIPLLTCEQLVEAAAAPIAVGYAIATHAIGDGANRLVLDAYGRLRHANPEALLRIEHAQVVHDDDVQRFGSLGVVPVVQPIHCTSDAEMAVRRLGVSRCHAAYRWRSLQRSAGLLLAGSDFPIESADPIDGIRAFVARRPDGNSAAWYGEECVSLQEALAAYTEWGVKGVPGSAKRGRLQAGFDADLTVLSGDPLAGGAVEATIVAGVPVYRQRDE